MSVIAKCQEPRNSSLNSKRWKNVLRRGVWIRGVSTWALGVEMTQQALQKALHDLRVNSLQNYEQLNIAIQI